MKEIWKDVEGYEGLYKVSNEGRFYSSFGSGRILKPCVGGSGYLTLALWKNKEPFTKTAHRLVALAFIPKIEGKNDINHKDGNKLNNNVLNLEWATRSENMIHAYRTGLRGKVTENQALEIRALKGQISEREIAKNFGFSQSLINNILNRKTWKHI